MCRLFGFRSIIESRVHTGLVSAKNALAVQSKKHPDGWGMAYYVENFPHLMRSAESAFNSSIFRQVSGVLSSHTVIAHIRNATLGDKGILNTHPFQFGHWTFAHNGNIKVFSKCKKELLGRVSPYLRRFILGQTDSEIIFYLILSKLQKDGGPYCQNDHLDEIYQAVSQALAILKEVAGDYCPEDRGEEETYYTFLLSDGVHMLAFQGGKELYYSTHKTKCSERDTCPSFSEFCEKKTEKGQVSHILFSSEPLAGENVWYPMQAGQMIGVDSQMRFSFLRR